MDQSDKREPLLSTLKLAYKKIGTLNAATRKINAIMAILLMKRDKAKTDVETTAKNMLTKISKLQVSFEEEITSVVDVKVKVMEDKLRAMLEEICSLGEVCTKADEVLKIHNEYQLASDGEPLTFKLTRLMEGGLDIEDQLADLEDSMFIQFVPADLDAKFEPCVFGKVLASNKDSGVPVPSTNLSKEVVTAHQIDNLCARKTGNSGCSDFMQIHSPVKKSGKQSDHPAEPSADVSKQGVQQDLPPVASKESAHTASPLGLRIKKPGFTLHYVNNPPNKASAQRTLMSSEARLGSKLDGHRANGAPEHGDGVTQQGENESKAQGSDKHRFPAVGENWEEEMYEVKELSSAMSVRLQKNIYDRMNRERKKAGIGGSEKGSSGSVEVSGRDGGESWESNPEEDIPPAAVQSVHTTCQSHVRKLFEEELEPVQRDASETWEDPTTLASEPPHNDNMVKDSRKANDKVATKLHKDTPIPSYKFQTSYSQPVSKLKDISGMFQQKAGCNKTTDDWDEPSAVAASGNKSPLKGDSKPEPWTVKLKCEEKSAADNWDDVEHAVTKTGSPLATIPEVDVTLTECGDGFTGAPVVELYSWTKTSKTGIHISQTGKADKNIIEVKEGGVKQIEQGDDSMSSVDPVKDVATQVKKESDKHGNSVVVERTPEKKDVCKKTGSIISGRMKNLLKNHIESNKECIPVSQELKATGTHSPKCQSPKKSTGRQAKHHHEVCIPSSASTTTVTNDKPAGEEALSVASNHSTLHQEASLTANTSIEPPRDVSSHSSSVQTNNPPEKKKSQKADVSSSEKKFKSPSTVETKSSEIGQGNGHSQKAESKNNIVKVYIDVTKLVKSRNYCTELPATLLKKFGSQKKGAGEGFFFPIGVSYTSAGDIVIADSGNNLVKIIKDGHFDLAIGQHTTMNSKAGVTLSRPSAVVVNDQDQIFVKDDHEITKFDSKGKLLLRFGRKVLKRPYGLALVYTGDVATLDVVHPNHLLYLFHQDGNVAKCNVFGPLAPNMARSKCRFLEVYGDQILVSDLGLSVMYLGNVFTGQVFHCFGWHGTAPGMFREPSGVTVDSQGNWLVADSKNDRIQVFSPTGRYMFPVKLSEPIYRPSDIRLTKDRHLLVVNYLTHSVNVFKL